MLAAALCLAGCFYSQDELIGWRAAHTPIRAGEWIHTPTHPDGSEWGGYAWRGDIRNQRRRLTSRDANFPHEGLRFRRLHEDIYIAQFPGQAGYGYGVAFVYERGTMVSYHMPDCTAMSEAVREEAGVETDDDGFCRIRDLDHLESVIRAYLDARAGELVIDGVYRRVG